MEINHQDMDYQSSQPSTLPPTTNQLLNHYPFKSYKLEENPHSELRNPKQPSYDSPKEKSTPQQEQEQVQQEFVFVPFEIISPQPNQQERRNQQQPQASCADAIYVFDDEEAIESKPQEATIKAQEITFKKKSSGFEDITWKLNERGNISTEGLLTPPQHKTTIDLNFSIQGQQLFQSQPKDFKKKYSANSHDTQALVGTACLKGVQVQSNSKQNGLEIIILDKKVFSMSSLPSGVVLKCIIKRSSSFLNMLSPEYDLYLANGLKHILSAKKYSMRNRQLFRFSTDPFKFNDSRTVAVMHANSDHSVYWLVDLPRSINFVELSFIHLILGYHPLKREAQRKFEVLVPPINQLSFAVDYHEPYIDFASYKVDITTRLTNSQLKGGPGQNSTKNFVLSDGPEPADRFLELRKESDNLFQMTVQHPLSPLQAMAIAMTRFDAQLN